MKLQSKAISRNDGSIDSVKSGDSIKSLKSSDFDDLEIGEEDVSIPKRTATAVTN